MKKHIKIIILEDAESDILLINYHLAKANFQYTYKAVSTEKEFDEALKSFPPDIILSDYHLPSFSGIKALEIVQNQTPETPFIFVTGVLKESKAVELLRKGAWDYILKDNFIRLIPAIENCFIIKEKNDQVRKATRHIEESRLKYLELYENAPDMFLTFNFNTGIISECNQTLIKKTGYNKDELIGYSLENFYPLKSLKNIKENFLPKILQNGKIENEEIEIIKKDGSILYGMINAKSDYNTENLISNIHISVRDISEIKKKDVELRESEERFKHIFNKTFDFILIFDFKKSIPILTELNIAAKQFFDKFGISYLNKPVNFFIPHIPEKEILEILNKIDKVEFIRDKIIFNRTVNKTEYFDVIASKIFIKNRRHLLITARNISEQHYAEQNLIQQKESFKSLYESYLIQNEKLETTISELNKSKRDLSKTVIELKRNKKTLSEKVEIINKSPVVSFIWENKPGWPVNYVSENSEQIFGYTTDDFLNHSILYEDIIHPDDLSYVKDELLKGIKDKSKRIKHSKYRIITKDKQIKWVKDDTNVVFKNNKVLHFEGIITDITEQTEYQTALQISEKKYRSMLDADPDIVIISSKDKKIQYMNPAAIKKFGFYESGVICHKKLFGLKEPCNWCAQKEADKYKKTQNEIFIPNDKTPYLLTFSKIIENNGQSVYMSSYKDISDIKKLQNERLQFLNILETGLNEVYIVNPQNFSINYVNSASVRASGYSKEVLLKMNLFDLQKNESKNTYRKYLKILKIKQKKEVHFETFQIRKDGTKYPVSVYLKLIIHANKSNLLVFVNDITEQKENEETINLLSTAIYQSPAEVVITDRNGNIEYVNPKFTEVTGYSFKEVKGKNSRILKSGTQSPEFYKNIWETISSGKIWKGEFLNKRKKGELYWEDAVISPVKNNVGEITHYIALKEDITEQKQIREQLIKSELHFRLLFENSLIGMYLSTPEGKILNANKALVKLLGFNSLEELKGINLENSKKIVTNRKKFIAEINKTGFVIGLESIWSNAYNQLIYVRENARKYIDEEGNEFYEGTVEDITSIKLAEKELRQITELNKHIIRVGHLGYAIYETNGDCIAANKTYADILGTDVPELLRHNFRKSKNWKESHLIEIADKCLKYGNRTKQIINEESSYNKNIWIEINFSRIYNENRAQLLIIIKDISSYMRAKRKQLQTKSEYFDLLNSINTPVFGFSKDCKINEWNKAMEDLTGYNRIEVKKRNIETVFNINEKKLFNKYFNNNFNKDPLSNEELDIINKSGEVKRLLLSNTLKINDDEDVIGIICIAQDITKQENYKIELEKKVHNRTQKLIEALEKEKELSNLKSQFVSMASHEFRTPLSAIKFAAGFIRKYYDKAEKIKIEEKANKIETQVNHMTTLLEDVLTIGKIENGKIKFQAKELNFFNELKKITEDVIVATKNTHQINFDFNDKKCILISDEKILRNIFNNLLSNAIKFSPEEKEIFLKVISDENKILVEIKDKGIGIKNEELKSIFNPFRRGQNVETIQGTGLGLAIVKESVDLLKGTISVESEYGKGTIFTVILPRHLKT